MIPVLLYHKVIDEKASIGEKGSSIYSIRKTQFENQMQLLSKMGFNCITLDQYVNSIKTGKPLSRKGFVITFDDGYKDLLSIVQPVFFKTGFKATIFIIPGKLPDGLGSEDNYEYLSWQEIAMLNDKYFSIGNHSYSHIRLIHTPTEIQKRELIESKEVIEEHLGKEVKYFAYPYGVSSPQLFPLLQEIGYEAACGVDRGEWNLYNIWRLRCDHHNNLIIFLFRILCIPYLYYYFREVSFIGKRTSSFYKSIKINN